MTGARPMAMPLAASIGRSRAARARPGLRPALRGPGRPERIYSLAGARPVLSRTTSETGN